MNDSDTHYFLELDSQKKIFRLTAPVFQGSSLLPQSVALFFATQFSEKNALSMEKNNVVMLCEEIPVSWGPQPTLRQQFYRFTNRARQCRHLFGRLAQFEHRDNVEILTSSKSI